MTNKFSGTGVAIITPFNKDETIDFVSLKNLINFQIENKVEYIVTLGTTGESATLNQSEKEEIVKFTKETIRNRVPLVVGIGGNNTKEVLKNIEKTNLTNIDAILSVCPYYNKPSQQGIYQHYNLIADNSPAPIILYNVPGRTGTNINSETTLKLANNNKNIIAIKEASGNFEQIMQIIKYKPLNFSVISGDDAITLPMITVGATGVISVTANAFPYQFSEMVRLTIIRKLNEAKQIHYKLLDIYQALFAEGSPGGIKSALEILGYCKNYFRTPITPISQETYNHIKTLISKI